MRSRFGFEDEEEEEPNRPIEDESKISDLAAFREDDDDGLISSGSSNDGREKDEEEDFVLMSEEPSFAKMSLVDSVASCLTKMEGRCEVVVRVRRCAC